MEATQFEKWSKLAKLTRLMRIITVKAYMPVVSNWNDTCKKLGRVVVVAVSHVVREVIFRVRDVARLCVALVQLFIGADHLHTILYQLIQRVLLVQLAHELIEKEKRSRKLNSKNRKTSKVWKSLTCRHCSWHLWTCVGNRARRVQEWAAVAPRSNPPVLRPS